MPPYPRHLWAINGLYPEVSLKEARNKRDASRKLLENEIDPAAFKLARKTAISEAAANSFEVVALEWYEKNKNPHGQLQPQKNAKHSFIMTYCLGLASNPSAMTAHNSWLTAREINKWLPQAHGMQYCL